MIVAVLLLPALWGLLLGMSWWEERLFSEAGPRHARARRHLRLIRGGHEAPRDTDTVRFPARGRDAA